MTDADIGAMNDLVTRMEAATGEGVSPDIDLITELNGAFHGAIVTASGNSLLPELMNSLIHVPVVSHTYRLYSPARMQQSMRQHRELLDAVTAGDPAWAEAVMRVHILSARPVLVRRGAMTPNGRPGSSSARYASPSRRRPPGRPRGDARPGSNRRAWRRPGSRRNMRCRRRAKPSQPVPRRRTYS